MPSSTAVRRHAPTDRPRNRAALPDRSRFLQPDPERAAKLARWGEGHVRERLAMVRSAVRRAAADVAELSLYRDARPAHLMSLRLACWSARLAELTSALEILRERDAAAPAEGRP